MALLDRTLGRFDESRIHQAEADRQHPEHGGPLYTMVTAKYVHARYAELYEGRRDTAALYDEVIAGGRYCQHQDPEVNSGCWVEALGHLGKRDYSAVLQII